MTATEQLKEIDTAKYTQKELADMLGKTISTVSFYLKENGLPFKHNPVLIHPPKPATMERICCHCKDIFIGWSTSKYCSKQACQDYKYLVQTKKIDRHDDDVKEKSVKRKDIPSKRFCKKCGKPAYPNYFYCNRCLSIISDGLSDPEEVFYGVW